MNIPFGGRQVVVELKKNPVRIETNPAIVQASDREIEQFARHQKLNREPRWESHLTLYGWHS
jgi:hypothetical protein